MSATEEQKSVNSNLQKQDLTNLDIGKLTPLSPEVISRQATINIGTIGHVAHGKSTVVKAISGVQTVRFKNELERNITIKLERISYEKLLEISRSSEKLNQYIKKQNAKLSRRKAELLKFNSNNGLTVAPYPLQYGSSSKKKSLDLISMSSSCSSGYASLKDFKIKKFKIPSTPSSSLSSSSSSSKTKEYTVEKIIELSESRGKPLFHVKWLYYPDSQNTWEPFNNIRDCIAFETFIDEYWEKYEQTIEDISNDIINEMKNEGFSLNDDELDIKIVEEFDNFEHMIDLILLALFKLSKSKAIYAERLIRERIKKQILIKPKYHERQRQLLELYAWKSSINKIESTNINIENNIDYEVIPHASFNYIIENVSRMGIIIPDDPPIGCACIESDLHDSCSYFSKCCGKMSGSKFAYNSKRQLRIEFGIPIFECNKNCKCSSDCVNRVVQNGRKNSLCVFKTANGCGWGIKTEKPIKKGEFICEYVGELITANEADRRGKFYDAQIQTYLFDLDFEENECKYTIDATNYGNISRFINHSCDPNSSIWPVWVDCLDPNLPRLALFALRRIEAGEEISFDYINQNMSLNNSDNNDYKNNSDAEKCLCRCGSNKCRKYLF